jgi:peptidoglycan/LPS O-acetylase OafA/YrhL
MRLTSHRAMSNGRAVTTTSSPIIRPRMPELDSVRGVAVLLVLVYHGLGFSYQGASLTGVAAVLVRATVPGWIGVNLFFVLSGFLITGILIDNKREAGYYKHFYTRRALRILPAYYGLLMLFILLNRVAHLQHRPSWPFLILSFFYLSNVTPLFGIHMDYGPLWSLAVEEHFYLVWPVVVHQCSRWRLVTCALIVCFTAPLLRAFAISKTGAYQPYTWYMADSLAMGAILAILARTNIGRIRFAWVTGLVTILGGTLILSTGLASGKNAFIVATKETALGIFFTGILGLVLFIGTSNSRNIVNLSVMQFLGYISYGLYLIHLLVFDAYDQLIQKFWPAVAAPTEHILLFMLLRFGIPAGLSILLAYLSRRYFEEYFMRLKRHPVPRSSVGAYIRSVHISDDKKGYVRADTTAIGS